MNCHEAKFLPFAYRGRVVNSIVVIVFVLLLGFAWSNRFVQDDAYISFRYADNLVNGHGLVWNVGERVEGYSNFLWTLIIALAMKAGFPAPESSVVIGLVLFAGSLFLCFRISMILFAGSRLKALAVLLLTGSNYTFSAYASGGLETQLQAFLLLFGCYIFLSNRETWTITTACMFSVVLALGFLTRMDFAIFASVLFGAAAVSILKPSDSGRQKKTALICAMILPSATLVVPWLAWKLFYYGHILPNTYYVKVSSSNSLVLGVQYLYYFMNSYGFFPAVGFLVISGLFVLIRKPNVLILFVLIVALWTTYIVSLGGCFMEFRLFVPIIPFLMVLLVWLVLDSGMVARNLGIVCVLAVVTGSAIHMVTFKKAVGRVVAPISHLHALTFGWELIGRQLRKDVGNLPVTIATTAGGAISYYSRLTVIDMHGLTDQWIAHHGVILGSMPGHQRGTTVEYLIQRNVNLVVAHPLWIPRGSEEKAWLPYAKQMVTMYCSRTETEPGRVAFVLIPIEHTNFVLAVWYLTKSPEVDAICEEKNWALYEFPVKLPASSTKTDPKHLDIQYWLSQLKSVSVVPRTTMLVD